MTSTVQTAIDRSVSHNEIVTIPAAEYSEEVLSDLQSSCDDSVRTSYEHDYKVPGKLIEFWGRTHDGDTWRVHLECGAARV